MTTEEIKKINEIIEKKEYLGNKDIILNVSDNKELERYFLDKLPNKFDDIRGVEFILNELLKKKNNFFFFKITNILEGSLAPQNDNFIIDFIERHYGEFEFQPKDTIFQEQSLRIIEKIISQNVEPVNLVFNLVKKILTSRGIEYKDYRTKRDYEEEKRLLSGLLGKVFSAYKNRGDNQKIEEIISLINAHFNLVGDDGDFGTYTPAVIFTILKEYIDLDFEKNFKTITKILVDQYSDDWNKYDGWEFMGGMTSSYGYEFTVFDRHFIRFCLNPALEEYYKNEKEKAWQFIISNCIHKTKEVSKEKPDFLNRATISVVVKRCAEEKGASKEALEILKEFVLSNKGIPHKLDLIFQMIKGGFPEDKKKQLLEFVIERNKDKLPFNAYVEQNTLELAGKGDENAKKLIRSWIKNPKYYEGSRIFEGGVVKTLSKFLDISFKEGVEAFEDFIGQEHFIKNFESFDTFEVSHLLNIIINKNLEVGLKILNQLAEKPVLSDNEQIILFGSLTNKGGADKDNEEILMGIYNGFLDKFLDSFNNDIKRIEAKITRPNSREDIVQFADVLAKHKKISEMMRIVGIFINDSDPVPPGEVDPEDKYNEHKRIEKGEDTRSITTVRGWCAWVLTQCAVSDGREYIKEVIEKTEKLTKDPNYYVKHMSCFPLSQLALNRLTYLPDNKEVLFLDDDVETALKLAKKIEDMAFALLKDISTYSENVKKILGESIISVFDHLRSLNEKRALELVETLKDFPNDVVAKAAPLFIFFAEFRSASFKDWRWKKPGLFDDLEIFNDEKFKKVMVKAMLKSADTKRSFAWHFDSLPKSALPEKVKDKDHLEYNKAFEIAYKYLNILVENYESQSFHSIYYFIKENMAQKFTECYELWIKVLKGQRVEIERMIKESASIQSIWWLVYESSEILVAVKEYGGAEKFLESFETLLKYPKEFNANFANDGVVKVLQELPPEYKPRVEKIFDELISKNPIFYDAKENWLKNQKQ